MADKVRDLIKYEGISSCPGVMDDCSTYKQINSEGMLCIPDCKPNAEQIVKVWGEVEITYDELVQTPIGVSLEGQILTGLKLLLVGEIKFKVQYVACNEERSVHTAHFLVPMCEYIVVPKGSACAGITKKVFIEDLHVNLMDERCFFYNAMILLKAKLS